MPPPGPAGSLTDTREEEQTLQVAAASALKSRPGEDTPSAWPTAPAAGRQGAGAGAGPGHLSAREARLQGSSEGRGLTHPGPHMASALGPTRRPRLDTLYHTSGTMTPSKPTAAREKGQLSPAKCAGAHGSQDQAAYVWT